MANVTTKKDMIIDVQPITAKEDILEFIECLGMTKLNADRNVLLFKLGISTGLRIGDIVKLKVSDVKGKSSFKIKEGKTKKERTVYLSAIMPDIADYTAGMDADNYLFPSQKGSHITTTQAYRVLVAAGNLMNRQDIGTHTMRKTFGYHYYKKTKDVATLMEIFNHSKQSITLKYIAITEEEVADSLKDFRLF